MIIVMLCDILTNSVESKRSITRMDMNISDKEHG